MKKEKQLIKSLDNLFGFEYIKNSSVKKLKQYFDEKRNEHVFVIEYRVVKGDKHQLKKDENFKRRYNNLKNANLLRLINQQAGRMSMVDNVGKDSP